MFKISNPKILATILLGVIPFLATLVKVWINPDLGNVVQSEAPQLFALAPAGTTTTGEQIVVATPLTSSTVVVSESTQ